MKTTDLLMRLNENERNGNDYCLAGGGHGDWWLPFLAEMSFEEVQRNVEMRMNGDLESPMLQSRHAPSDVTDGAADLK